MVPAEAALTLTVSVAVAVPQKLLTVYNIVAVPEAIPVTTPEPLTSAMPGALLLQTPPVTASVSEVVLPAHRVVVPDTVPAEGGAATDNSTTANDVPQPEASA